MSGYVYITTGCFDILVHIWMTGTSCGRSTIGIDFMTRCFIGSNLI